MGKKSQKNTWIRWSDRWTDDDLMTSLSSYPAAFFLFHELLAISHRNMQDGFVSDEQIRSSCLTPKVRRKALAKLLSVPDGSPLGAHPALNGTEGGVQIVSYLDWQQSRDEIEAEQARKDAERARSKARQETKRQRDSAKTGGKQPNVTPESRRDVTGESRRDTPQVSSSTHRVYNPKRARELAMSRRDIAVTEPDVTPA